MVDVIVRKLEAPKASKSVKWKTVTGQDGSSMRVRSLNADSETFSGDLLRAFRSNVRNARLKNKQVAGK